MIQFTRSFLTAVLIFTLAGCSLAVRPDREPTEARVASTSIPVPVSSELFTFYSHPRINLHHFLYQWARAEADPSTLRRPILPVPEREGLGGLPAAERGAWQAAVDLYRQRLVPRSLLFDDGMVSLRDQLGGLLWGETQEEMDEVLETIDGVESIYRRHWWPSHRAANERWIEELIPRLERVEKTLSERLARAVGGEWPAERIRVDVTAYANDLGGYTTGEPHVVITSTDPDYQGLSSLEMVFHEACHGDALEGPLRHGLEKAFAEHGGRPPGRLWHQIQFLTVGEITRAALVEAGIDGYEPYALRHGMYERRRDWPRTRAALEKHWLPYLAGTGERAQALSGFASELAAPPD